MFRGVQNIIGLLTIILLLLPSVVKAQGAEDVLRHSLDYPSYDPQSMVMPGVTYNSGFGSFQENPAVVGLFEESFFSFSMSHRNVSEETDFQNTQNTFDDNQTGIGDMGFVYQVPTIQGSLVIGGGYSQTTDYNRAMGINLRNNLSTLTDHYNRLEEQNPSLYDAAFNVYAIDWADIDSTFTESIFRIGYTPEQFPGVHQNMELTERGKLGEYSAFFALEFQENFFVGASLGAITGNYKYEREFLESDPDNIYDGSFIDSDQDGTGDTDIDRILSVDTIESDFAALSARLGVIYQVSPNIRIGGSYEFSSRLSFDEEYNTNLRSTFDNNEGFEEQLPGEFSYKIKRPSSLNFGLSIEDLSGFTISLAAERKDYSNAELDLGGGEYLDDQASVNNFIDDEFKSVINLRGGLEFKVNEDFIPRIGYAWYPSPQRGIDTSREFFNAGLSARLSSNIWFDLGAQYTRWDDQNVLYSYQTDTALIDEVAQEQVSRLHVMAGIRIGFDY